MRKALSYIRRHVLCILVRNKLLLNIWNWLENIQEKNQLLSTCSQLAHCCMCVMGTILYQTVVWLHFPSRLSHRTSCGIMPLLSQNIYLPTYLSKCIFSETCTSKSNFIIIKIDVYHECWVIIPLVQLLYTVDKTIWNWSLENLISGPWISLPAITSHSHDVLQIHLIAGMNFPFYFWMKHELFVTVYRWTYTRKSKPKY